LNLV